MDVISCRSPRHDALHCSRGFEAMEKGVDGDDGGASASSGEVEASASRARISVYSWVGCSRSSLFTSPWTNSSRFGVHDPPRARERKRLHQVLAFLVASQVLRIVTFYSTQLPGPNYHCREGSMLAQLPPPNSVLEVLLINFPRGVLYGCGDLIFSSHMIFTLVFVLTYQKYGTKRLIKFLAWSLAIIQSLLIIGSRKHYTVDVVVAWYTVNLVVFFVDKKLPEMPDRATGSSPLLPLSTKEKDGRSKDELHKLLNGNSVDSADRRQRTQMNGKHSEDANHVHSDLVAANGTL